MSAPPHIKLIAENLAPEARALAPGEGRRPVEVDATGLRLWLDHFAALPALEADDAEARLHVTIGSRRLVVRWAGTRLGAEEGGTFVAATPDEIMALVLAAPQSVAVAAPAEDAPAELRATSKRVRAQAWLLAGLLVILAAVTWWTTRPETPEGVEWVTDAADRRAILSAAAGGYASDDEKLQLDAVSGRLVATDADGNVTLDTAVRVGRRAGANVLVTESGVLLELAGAGRLRIAGTEYRR